MLLSYWPAHSIVTSRQMTSKNDKKRQKTSKTSNDVKNFVTSNNVKKKNFKADVK